MTDPVNLLKPFLFETLPAGFELNEGEVLVDALVVVRIMDPEDGGERLEYTTSRGLSIFTARGMIEQVKDQLAAIQLAAVDGIRRADNDDDPEEV